MPKPVGSQELRILQFVAQHGPLTVGEAAERLGAEMGLARTTIQTILERLRQKRHLVRRRVNGVYAYSSPASHSELMRDTVAQFVGGALEGSISPFVAYLAERGDVSDDELRELKRIVRRLDASRRSES